MTDIRTSLHGKEIGLGHDYEIIVNRTNAVSLNPVTGAGAKNGATVAVEERSNGIYRETKLTLTNTPVAVVSVTTGAGVAGTKIYDFPEGHLAVYASYASLTLSIATANQADFTDGTPEGDIGIGTAAPADADALGNDATDDDICTSTAFTMASYAVATSFIVPPDSAAQEFDGSSTAKDVYVNILVDAADIDDDTTSEILVSGTVFLRWIFCGDNG